MPKHFSNLGFTLVELVIVITIIGILTALALPGFFTTIRRTTFQNKIGEVVQLIERARTQALASEIDSNDKIPPGGYGVHFDFGAQTAQLFIDDYNASGVGASVNVNYADVAGRIIPDQVFTKTSGDTILKTVVLDTPDYLNFLKLSGMQTDGTPFAHDDANEVTIIFTPPYADTILRGTDDGPPFMDLQDVTMQFKLVTDNLTRSIKINRITTTPQVIKN